MIVKPGVERFIKIVKRIFIGVSCVWIPGVMVCLVYAFEGAMAFWIISPAVIIAYLAMYIFYALHYSMSAVIGYELTPEVIHIKTKRKTYTYDRENGCIGAEAHKNKYVCTFATQDSVDKYIFYLRVPFSKAYEEQFTEEEILKIYPKLHGEETEELPL